MPVKDQKRGEGLFREYQGQLDQLLKEVEDLEFLERLAENQDYQKLVKIFEEGALRPLEDSRKEAEEALRNRAMTPAENGKFLELVKILTGKLQGARDLVSFVGREIERLKGIRVRVIPELREKIKELEGGENDYAKT